ncbi:hypothetical protein C8A05DRAFT_11311 [Staphylotrichum tortipilum]|uniref:Uncharacterized protein n=1 Tax=Staphylotrichum tortipilum TaxID=2831512 RepID=A0AAN6MU20_9PEZI|nr:hypothetical protein C8A05DRAFT_11311 [Staphylotrichum longicolle]
MEELGIEHQTRHHPRHPPQHHHEGHGASFAAQSLLPLEPSRKRKADGVPESNERLSKRLSLLNLDQPGGQQTLSVPVERLNAANNATPSAGTGPPPRPPHHHSKHHRPPLDDSQMELDDSKHKVYIYNLDDELSSDTESETDGGGRLVFLADMDKHLRDNCRRGLLPPSPGRALDPRPDPTTWAGKELVLYRVPSSISVPEEQDSVRKAIIEARARVKERQKAAAAAAAAAAEGPVPVPVSLPVRTASPVLGDVAMDAASPAGLEDDPDAMEID